MPVIVNFYLRNIYKVDKFKREINLRAWCIFEIRMVPIEGLIVYFNRLHNFRNWLIFGNNAVREHLVKELCLGGRSVCRESTF